MNRKLMLGIAGFLAIVGFALVGGESQVEAGLRGCGGKLCGGLFANRSRGCCGEVEPACPAPCPAPCPPSCGGRRNNCGGGLLARLRAKHAERKARRGCCGEPAPCCEAPAPCCEPDPCCKPARKRSRRNACCAPAPCNACSACGAGPAEAVEEGKWSEEGAADETASPSDA